MVGQRGVVAVSVVIALLAAGLGFSGLGAVTGSVVISEIFYNQPDLPNGEPDPAAGEDFIELHNPGTAAIDLTGFTLDDEGSAEATPAETVVLSGTLQPGAYVYITRSGYDAQAVFGIAPIARMEFGLSGGGDTVTLRDNSGELVDEVTYTDDPPWPGEPDGDGPSLELRDAQLDNSVAASWGASNGAPTPGAANSIAGTAPAEPITNVVATPFEPAVNQAVTVVAEVPGENAPLLHYVVGFGAEVEVAMTPTNNGMFTAIIPGQAAGELIRYRIEAPSTGEEFPTNDGRNYEGVVVADPAEIPTGLVEIEWFIPEADHDFLIDTRRDREAGYVFGSVLAIDGVVYDNMEVRIRGGGFARNTLDKQSFNFDFSSGVDASVPQLVPHPIDEFALIAEYGFFFDRTYASWEVFEDAGFPPVPAEHVRVQRNGEFYGLFRFSEKLDGTWRDVHGIEGEFYEAGGGTLGPDFAPFSFDKRQPDDGDFSNLVALRDVVTAAPSEAKTDDFYDSVDIPNIVNFMAASNLVGHFDSRGQNYFVHLDDVTDRWEVYPWDLTNTFGIPNGIGGCEQTSELSITCNSNALWDSVEEIPELEEMVWRRMRTLLDSTLVDGELEGRFQAYRALISQSEIGEDQRAWDDGFYRTNANFNFEVDTRRNLFLASPDLPASQGANPGIVINEIHHSPNTGVEFLELVNPTSASVDMSGWEIPGLRAVLPPGTVILPGGYVVLTEVLREFDVAYPDAPNVVLVSYEGGLSGGGELVELISATGQVIDSVEYTGGTPPWPTEPSIGDQTLSLDDPASDNANGANWGISLALGGTPGAANDTIDGTVTAPPAVVINELHYNPADG